MTDFQRAEIEALEPGDHTVRCRGTDSVVVTRFADRHRERFEVALNGPGATYATMSTKDIAHVVETANYYLSLLVRA